MTPVELARLRRRHDEFHALFDADDATRGTHLAALAREDAGLAADLDDMLRRADAGRDEDAAAAGARSGCVVGNRYRLLREISVGGMGEVYLAERLDEVHKQVALKLMRADLPLTLERARREQDILARLVHPNIAGLIDAGTGDDGRPWFAMDYIAGEHIDSWSDHRRLDLGARVALFARVCSAVHFAHKNLVLHRDLKPSNILIDGGGAPKLLDFGIAKMLGADAAPPGATQTLALTPAYASPEQLRGESATTASDVYQLGLVLHVLLCGVGARCTAVGATEPARIDRAFAALSSREPAAAERIAAARDSRPSQLRRALRGDLARIVAKAVATETQERYDTAQALAEDLERWNAGRPVAAHRGSFAYRAGKLIRRNAIASAAIALLVCGLLVTSIVAVDRARSEHAQRVQAEQQGRRLASLLEFLREAFREGDPNSARGEKLGAVELLNRAHDKLKLRNDLDEPTRASLQTQIAQVLLDLEQANLALAPARAALATFTPVSESHALDYLQSVAVLSETQQTLGDYQAALDVIGPALPLARRTFGGDHLWFAYLLTQRSISLMRLARFDSARNDLDAALAAFADAGDQDSKDFLLALNGLANLAANRSEYRKAVDLYGRIVRIASSHPVFQETDLIAVKNNLAMSHYFLGETKTAIDLFEPLVRRYDALQLSAQDHAVYARIMLAACELADGDYARARSVLAEIPAATDASGARGPLTRWRLQLVEARLALYSGRGDEALRLLGADAERALPSAQRTRSQRIQTNELTAQALLQQGRAGEAAELLQQGLRDAHDMADEMGLSSTLTLAMVEDGLGRAYSESGDFAQAQTHLAAAVRYFSDLQGPGKPYTVRSEIHLLWARALATRDPASIERIDGLRADLVAALGGDAKVQIWQTDLLIDRLSRAFGRPGIDSARRTRAETELLAIGDAGTSPRFVGLNGF